MPALIASFWAVLSAAVTTIAAMVGTDCPNLAEKWPMILAAGITAGMGKFMHSGRPKE